MNILIFKYNKPFVYFCKSFYDLHFFTFAFLMVILSSNVSYAQSTIEDKVIDAPIELKLLHKEIEIKKGEAISNVLKVINNNNSDSIFFSIDLFVPKDWQRIGSSNKTYNLAPHDSIYIPLRILPNKLMKGNTKYFINLFAISEGVVIENSHFFATTKKLTRWELSLKPNRINYFKNREDSINFSLNIFNSGSQKQDMILALSTVGPKVQLYDSTGIINNPYYSFNLDYKKDTNFHYILRSKNLKRNQKLIDIEGYIPNVNTVERKYLLGIKTFEPSLKGDGHKVNESALFIKLPNIRKVKNYSGSVLPLTLNIENIDVFSDYKISIASLRGMKFFKDKSLLFYSTNMYYLYSANYDYVKYTRDIPFFISYTHHKYKGQFGNISGNGLYSFNSSQTGASIFTPYGMSSSGKGIKLAYRIDSLNSVMASYIRSPYLFSNASYSSYTAGHSILIPYVDGLSANTIFSLSNNDFGNNAYLSLTINERLKITKSQTIGISLSGIKPFFNTEYINNYTSSSNDFGLLLFANYGGTFKYNHFKTQLNLNYTTSNKEILSFDSNFTNKLNQGRINLNHNTNYDRKKIDIQLRNQYRSYYSNYSSSTDTSFTGYRDNYVTNYLSAKFIKLLPKYRWSIFYNINSQQNMNLHLRGFMINFSDYNLKNSLRYSASTSFGYSRLYPASQEYLFTKINANIFYKVYSLNAYYNSGAVSPRIASITDDIDNPQNFRASLRHQYQFKNRYFILNTALNYSYNNIFEHHSFNFNPNLYFYTKTGWRFRLGIAYNFSSNKFYKQFSNNPYAPTTSADPLDDEVERRNITQQYPVSFGIRKEFGVPIPTKSNEYRTIDFVAFYDLNGNDTLDRDEPKLENIVISANKMQVISNIDGKARIENIEPGNYAIRAFSLENLKGWFPKLEDSTLVFQEEQKVYIPYVRGVKITGNVFLDQEKIMVRKIEMGGLKVIAKGSTESVTLTNDEGAFEFYLPHAIYIFTMKDDILGKKFRLLKNNIKLDLTDEVDNIYISFQIIEKKRKLKIKKFNSSGNAINQVNNFNSPNSAFEIEVDTAQAMKYVQQIVGSGTSIPNLVQIANMEASKKDLQTLEALLKLLFKNNPDMDIEAIIASNSEYFNNLEVEGLVYRLQIAESATEVPATYFAQKFNISNSIYVATGSDGRYKYSIGSYKTKNIALKAYSDFYNKYNTKCFVSYYFEGKRIEWEQLKTIFRKILNDNK